MDLRDRRETYNGFGEALARAFEFAVTPMIFGLGGYGLDRLFGTLPIFTIVLIVLALVGMFVKLWFAYDTEMKVQESRGPWGRSAVKP